MSSSIYRLENHPLFDWPPSASKDDSAHAAGQSDGARPKRSLGMDANVFAVSRDLELFVVDRTNSLHCIHLRQRDSTKSPDYSVRIFRQSLDSNEYYHLCAHHWRQFAPANPPKMLVT
jgi:hypothetical protein